MRAPEADLAKQDRDGKADEPGLREDGSGGGSGDLSIRLSRDLPLACISSHHFPPTCPSSEVPAGREQVPPRLHAVGERTRFSKGDWGAITRQRGNGFWEGQDVLSTVCPSLNSVGLKMSFVLPSKLPLPIFLVTGAPTCSLGHPHSKLSFIQQVLLILPSFDFHWLELCL